MESDMEADHNGAETPWDVLPENLKESMGQAWRQKQENLGILNNQ
jgi:hypothetical protein